MALALALAAGGAHAASVRGTVVGGDSKAPLEGVEVVLRRASDSTVVAHTMTAADGRFRVDSLSFDHYLMRASLVGYEPWRRSDVTLSEKEPDLDLGRVVMGVAPIAMKPVDVSTERATAIIAPDRNIYLTRDLPSASTGSATDVLRGVPELDDMSALRGVPLPSGRATWDACAGAYGERKIVVGSRPSPTPDVMCHEVGHALDDLDSPPGKWQSDSAEFRMIYDQCQAYIASDFHRQRGGLGRKEFFADAFAAIASAQRPALVDMLSGNTRVALRVMLYFNRRYGI